MSKANNLRTDRGRRFDRRLNEKKKGTRVSPSQRCFDINPIESGMIIPMAEGLCRVESITRE